MSTLNDDKTIKAMEMSVYYSPNTDMEYPLITLSEAVC